MFETSRILPTRFCRFESALLIAASCSGEQFWKLYVGALVKRWEGLESHLEIGAYDRGAMSDLESRLNGAARTEAAEAKVKRKLKTLMMDANRKNNDECLL